MNMQKLMCLATALLMLSAAAVAQTVFPNGIVVGKVSRDCRIDGVKADGVTDDTLSINTCISNALSMGYGKVQLPSGQILISTSKTSGGINLTNIRGLDFGGAVWADFPGSNGSDPQDSNTTEIKCNTGNKPCMELTGSEGMFIHDLYFRAANTYSAPSQTGIVDARDNAGGGGSSNQFCFSQFNVLERVSVFMDDMPSANTGQGSVGLYNVGAEHFTLNVTSFAADRPAFFSAQNTLSITGAYQTIATGCPASMTIVDVFMGNFNIQNVRTGTAANVAVEIHDGFNFNFVNAHTITGNTVTNSPAFGLYTDSSPTSGSSSNIRIQAQIENANPASLAFPILLVCVNTDRLDLDVVTAATTAGTGSWIGFCTQGLKISNSRLRVKVANGQNLPLLQNGAATVSNSEINLGSTAATNMSALTLFNDIIHAPGFSTSSSLTLPAGFSGMLFDDDGFSLYNAVTH